MLRKKWLVYLLWGGLLLTGLASLLGLLVFIFPFWELANHFRPFILVGSVVLTVLAFIVGTSKTIKIGCIFVIYNSVLLVPAILNNAESALGASQNKGKQLTILTFNMWVGNTKLKQLVKLIHKENPDVVALQEFTQVQFKILSRQLKNNYRYQYSCSSDYICLLALFSKKPWIKIKHISRSSIQQYSQITDLDKPYSNPSLIDATFGKKNGKQYHILVTHIAWPFNPDLQVIHMDWLTRYVQTIRTPLILAGDINLSPWAWKMYQFQKSTGLKLHTTYLHSWPAHMLFPFVQLDHVFTTGEFKNLSVKVGSRAGSDHLPVIVRVKL